MTFNEWLLYQTGRNDLTGALARSGWRYSPEQRTSCEWDYQKDCAYIEWSSKYGEFVKIPSYVYFIQQGDAKGSIKIGVTKDPYKRIRTLKTSSPQPLQLLALFAGSTALESKLHRRFHSYRLNGEWFQPAPLLAWLDSLTSDERLEQEDCQGCKAGHEQAKRDLDEWLENYKEDNNL